tara:strand:- start:5805 stop:8213 length:2409 start_codon:yes stop_codon:yes gene_type:complete
MAMFKAFKPEAMNKIANAMGYSGDMGQFQQYIEQDPARQARMNGFVQAAQTMAKGGMVRKMQTGGILYEGPEFYTPQQGETLTRTTDSTRPYTAVMPRTGGEYAFKPDGTRVTVKQGYFDPRGGLQVGGNMGGPGPSVNLLTGEMAPSPDYSNTPMTNAGNTRMAAPAAQPAPTPAASQTSPSTIGEATMQRMFTPGVPEGGVTQAAMTPTGPGQDVAPGSGAVTGQVAVPTAMAMTAQSVAEQEKAANTFSAAQAAPAVDAAMNATQAAQTNVADPRAQVTAAQQTASSVGNLTEAQGNATLINSPVQRSIQSGELITGAANAQTAATFTEQVQAAQAAPSTQATVQGQLAQLTANFDATNPPAWAAGALRGVQAQMAQRGLGASSIAGQAMVQAAMESALPIASADAQTIAQFESQNLTNKQQRAMLAAQQRATFMGQEFDQAFQSRVQNAAKISEVANMNFTAEQQVQLENSRAANTMNLNNLSNSQAMVMAEAAALAQMDSSNLNNRQQSAVQNASNFMQLDMANLSNRQQTDLFKAQQRTQSMFTDAAATNAARQFNATSQNQVDQFFANLGQQTSQFNATQQNAQAQFNAGQANTVERFNAEMNNQRDQFNAQNQLVIAQSNAQWRRQIATADTAAVNRANELNANAVLDISKSAYDNLWTHYADTMEWAWTSAENELDRLTSVAVAELDADAQKALADATNSSASKSAIGGLIGRLGSAAIETGIFGCWVAREVYGPSSTDWVRFRLWLQQDAPKWLVCLYGNYGETFAKFVSTKPRIKKAIRYFMDKAIRSKFK